MSVEASVTLPEQPTNGSAAITALGGDGLRAPSSRTDVQVIATGDASAGTLSCVVEMDDRYTSLVDFAASRVALAAAAIGFRLALSNTAEDLLVRFVQGNFADVGALFTDSSTFLWLPPLFPLRTVAGSNFVPSLRVSVANTGVGKDLQLNLRVYNWKNIAQETLPNHVFIANMTPRSGD